VVVHFKRHLLADAAFTPTRAFDFAEAGAYTVIVGDPSRGRGGWRFRVLARCCDPVLCHLPYCSSLHSAGCCNSIGAVNKAHTETRSNAHPRASAHNWPQLTSAIPDEM
jgi:hypothetical protein